MIRKTLTILSLIGLLLSVGMLPASFWGVGYQCRPLNPTEVLSVLTANGMVQLSYEGLGMGTMLGWHAFGRRVIGPSWWRMPSWYVGGKMYRILIPLWLPIVLFAAYPAYRLLPFHRRRKRKKLGLCLKCGYDLRASKDRCPECGEEFGS